MVVMNKISFFLIIAVFISGQVAAQVYTNKEVGKKNEPLIDSLKATEYPYVLPIMGAKAAAKGFNLPYSAGLGINYLWQQSDLIIDNIMVGFNEGPMYDLQDVIRIDEAIATASGINLRPDIWLFPFLNVYGILAKAKTSTEIGAGLWLPDTSNNWNEITTFSSKAEFEASAVGFGLTPTMGVAGGWIALDMNWTWTDVSALNKPVKTFIFGPRIGKTFRFKNPDRNIAFWTGGFRLNLSAETNGSLNLSDLFSMDEIQGKVDQGLESVAETQIQVDTWWENLTPIEQLNPGNKAKYEAANRALEGAGNILTAADGALSNAETSTVQYSLEKKPKDMWNFLLGTQFQINKHFMVRAEYGFLGTRQQFIGGLQYRFGL
jgi:hypothetical protein